MHNNNDIDGSSGGSKNSFAPLMSLCDFFKGFLFQTIIIFLFCMVFIKSTKAESTAEKIETVYDTLTSITCETQGVGGLLKPEFAHTCIPEPFSNFLVANLLSPGLYANSFLRLNINDNELFPDACLRSNRADFDHPTISFSMCNNIKLFEKREQALESTVITLVSSIFSGKDPWEELKDSWSLSKSDYHKIFNNKKVGDNGIMYDVGLIPVFPWKVVKRKDRICVATQSFAGWVPIGCKFIKEPYPVSIYSDFMDLSNEGSYDSGDPNDLTNCSGAGSCYKRAYENSRTGVVMTGPLIECVKEMIAKVTISDKVCSFDDVDSVLSSNSRYTSSLFLFQKSMHTTVSALLTIYVILFGFKILLSGDIPPKSEITTFVIKFIFVIYFSVGINIDTGADDGLDRMDGMIQWAFPFLLDGMNQLASWMSNASPSGLCVFNDVYYPDNLRHLELWDSLDCKISHYLGIDAMQTMIVENASRNHNWERFDVLSFPIPPYVYFLIPAMMTGNFMLISLVLMFPLLVISIAAFIVNATVVCMISIVILGVLAPLFVPLFLFEYTKGYFEAWVKLLISFLLQPMVAVLFMTTMLAVFDFGFYGKCKYSHTDFSYGGANFTIKMDAGIAGASASFGDRVVRYYFIDQDWDNYTKEESESCQDSLGFILNNPYQFMFGDMTELASASMPWLNDSTGEEKKKRFDFLSAIKSSPGVFFDSVDMSFEKVKTLVIALFTASFILYLIYHLSESLAEFAADMTEGVSLSNMAIKPQSLAKGAMSALNQASKDQAATGGGGSKDSASTGGGRSGDSASTGGGRSGDSASTGGRRSGDSASTGGRRSGDNSSGKVD